MNNKLKHKSNFEVLLIIAIALSSIVVIMLIFAFCIFYSHTTLVGKSENIDFPLTAQIGDFIGGIFGTLLSSATIILLIYSIFLQKEENLISISNDEYKVIGEYIKYEFETFENEIKNHYHFFPISKKEIIHDFIKDNSDDLYQVYSDYYELLVNIENLITQNKFLKKRASLRYMLYKKLRDINNIFFNSKLEKIHDPIHEIYSGSILTKNEQGLLNYRNEVDNYFATINFQCLKKY